jgi:hypothetical protein
MTLIHNQLSIACDEIAGAELVVVAKSGRDGARLRDPP